MPTTYPPQFEQSLKRLLDIEAGFTDDSRDPGNWTGGRIGVGALKGTKGGIAANTYPDLDIKNLTLDQIKAIYFRDWWLKIGADVIPYAIVFQIWDMAVNSGMGNAKRIAQKVLGVAEDGVIGPVSLAAIKAYDLNDFLFRYNAEKIRYYTKLQTWSVHGKGWMNRTAENLDYCAKDN